MAKAEKKPASRIEYQSQYQLVIPGFEMPFEKHLDPKNRWVVMAKSIPWDRMVNIYMRKMGKSNFGTSIINPRMVLGALIIKHYLGYTDRETVEMIRENVYMQYFVGLSSFSHEAIFDPTLFVTIRKRLEESVASELNEIVIKYWKEQEEKKEEERELDNKTKTGQGEGREYDREAKIKNEEENQNGQKGENKEEEETKKEQNDHQGTLIIDATACPQAIAYPTGVEST